jgi:hypothetical protein
MNFNMVFLDGVKDEIRALTPNSLQLECMNQLRRARRGVFGLPLGPHPQTGDLTGCRKIYFGDTKWRIVVRYRPTERRVQVVEVIAVGPREAMDVYYTAVERLITRDQSSN